MFVYQEREFGALSNMSVSAPVMPTPVSASAMEGRRVIVEFRAATPTELRAVDTAAPEVVLPAHLLMNRAEWRRAHAAFPAGHHATAERPHGPPGSLIWAQLASRSGSMLVGGRDRFGMPSVPMPSPTGEIVFLSAVPAETARASERTRLPSMPVEHVIDEPDTCQPIIAANGEIRCASTTCTGCLTVLTRNSWYTSIACVCD